MNYNPAQLEHLEAEEAAREEAIDRIAALIRRFDLRPAELAKYFVYDQNTKQDAPPDYLVMSKPKSRTFDPFFDAW